MKQAIVAGGLNLDLCGIPNGTLVRRDSNIGRVEMRAGGVGHNIAARLAEMGARAELVTVLGDDDASVLLRHRCEREGVGLRYAATVPGASCCYLSLHETDGDMAAAVNAMALMERFTPDLLPLEAIAACGVCVCDANLPQETLEHLARNACAPLLLDPVSCAKAGRARGVLGRFAAVKPNLLEASLLSGEETPEGAAAWFLAQGVKRVFISLGARGVYAADARFAARLPAPALAVRNATGAGDAMAAGIAFGLLRGLDTPACAQSGLRAASEFLLRQGAAREAEA